MKGVLIGSDFLKLSDGIKFLEINTDIDITTTMMGMLELDNLINYLKTNEYTKLVLIYKNKHISANVVTLLNSTLNTNGIEMDSVVIPNNSITIPTLISEPNTFYLRCAYDVTAIVDDTYCRDKSEMASLLFNSNNESILPPTYVKDITDDTICDSFETITDNGEHPNVIIKKVLPDFEKTTYPQFHKLTSDSELTNLKSSLNDGLVLQEYKFNNDSLVDDRILDVVRTWNILLEDVETMIYLGGYVTANQLELDSSKITYTDNILDKQWRTMYYSNPFNVAGGIPNMYEVVKIIDDVEVVTNITEIMTGDVIKSISLSGLVESDSDSRYDYTFTGSLSGLFTYTTASVESIGIMDFEGWLPKINYQTNSTTGSNILTLNDKLIVKENNVFKFKNILEIENTDYLVLSNDVTASIDSINLEWYSGSIITIDIEPDDVFVAGTDLNQIGTNITIGGLILHNKN
jgi:hypothetical protein